MALTSTNFIKGRMNKSVDERLVPVGEYIDALNVRLGSTEGTEIGAVENSKGNSKITTVQYGGEDLSDDATTLGCFEDGMEETMYWFIHDANNPQSTTGVVDMVVSLNTNTNALVYHVISIKVLNFNPKYLITGVSKIEGLLFFTDDINPPRVINVNRNYEAPGVPTPGEDGIEEEDISVIVKPPGFEDYVTIPPLGAPHIELVELDGDENYIDTRFISFAYRYRYEDGQYSATSLFTTPAFEPGDFELNLQSYYNEGMINNFNSCKVTFSTGSKRVKEVDVLFKQSSSNVIYVIKRFIKENVGWSDNDFATLSFTNSEIYNTLGSDEILRLYDNVPRIAKAQTIQGNRLIYGNYVDGYDIKSEDDGSLIHMDYTTTGLSQAFEGVKVGNYISSEGPLNPSLSSGVYNIDDPYFNEANSVLTWDLSELENIASGGVIPQGVNINFLFTIQQTTPTICNPSGGSTGVGFCDNVEEYQNNGQPFSIAMTFIADTTYPNVADLLASQAFKNRIGGSVAQQFSTPYIVQSLYPCDNSSTGITLSDKFYNSGVNPMPHPVGISFNLFHLVSGGDAVLCSTAPGQPLSGIPFPPVCSSAVIASGTTDNVAVVVGQMTDTTANFNAAPTLVQVNDIVAVGNVAANIQAQVIGVTTNSLTLIDITQGAVDDLQQAGVDYVITQGGNTPAICPAQGFEYSNNNNQFSIKVPATQWYVRDMSNPGAYATAYRYYNFLQDECTLSYSIPERSGSLHSNRDYEVGVVYMDEYGRSSTVLTSTENTVFFPPNTSVTQNKITVTLNNLPPYWATKYKFVVKPSEGDYNIVYSTLWYKQDGTGEGTTGLPVAEINDPGQVWFRLEGQNANILQVGDELTVKSDTEGATLNQPKTSVLSIQSFSGKGITQFSQAGLYMLLKPEGWTIDSPNTNYFFGKYAADNYTDNFNDSAGTINNYSLNGPGGTAYDIPQGSIIRIRVRVYRSGKNSKKCDRSITYDRTFVSSDDYSNFGQWAIGDNLPDMLHTDSVGTTNIDQMDIGFVNSIQSVANVDTTEHTVKCWVWENSAGAQFFAVNGGLQKCTDRGGKHPGKTRLTIEVTRTPGIISFETVPRDADDNLFYDASDLMEINPYVPGGQTYHMAKRDFVPSGINGPEYILSPLSTDQSQTSPLVTQIDAYNCYTFGNGVESFKIKDSPAGKSLSLGERVMAVSNQDFKEADRFAGLTYSGVYSGSANVNNLNEFNLGLVNFKDCEVSFGPIQLLHSRRTDILTLQEDRITYVMSGKNIITDAVGGGAIVSVPEVLGQQVSRIEEYGISFNPESFVAWGSDMFFTDTKRGAVIHLNGSSASNDQISVISSAGMNSWFRDSFNAQLTTQKLGGYDPYMNEYVLGTNLNPVPVPVVVSPCGQIVEHRDSLTVVSYDVNLGLVSGNVDIPYNVTSGSIDIQVTWNNSVFTELAVNTSGVLSFNKEFNTPQTCSIVITPLQTSTYTVQVKCPDKTPLKVVQVVTNSVDYVGDFTRINYNWNDGVNYSPGTTPNPSVELLYNQPSYYNLTNGIRSLGNFPVSGADIKLQSIKLNNGVDTFDFNPNLHRFRILSSNVEYSNTLTDITSLIAVSSEVTPIINPVTGVFEAIEQNFDMPLTNEFLYLIWDLRLVTSQEVCYCTGGVQPEEVCCTCATKCKQVYIGPVRPSLEAVCTTNVNSPNIGSIADQVGAYPGLPIPPVSSFVGNNSMPTIGDIVYPNSSCSFPGLGEGFYIVNSTYFQQPGQNWIQVSTGGLVINNGTC